MSPAQFLPLIENTSLSISVGKWVFRIELIEGFTSELLFLAEWVFGRPSDRRWWCGW